MKTGIKLIGFILLLGLNFQGMGQHRSHGEPLRKGRISLKLTVRDSHNRNAVEYATLLLKKGKNRQFSGITDEKGSHTFLSIPKGDYELTVTSLGYKSRTIDLHARRDTTLTILLLSNDIAMQDVVVTAYESRGAISASRIDRTFPYLVGELLECEVVNMGIAGIRLNPGAAKVLGTLAMDQLVVSIGANDWREGMLPDKFRVNLEKFLHDFRSFQPDTPVVLVSPMWLSGKFKAPLAHHSLQEFRDVYAAVAAASGDPALRVIDGSVLIDHDPALYEPDHVHPRDAGIEQLAERLAEQLI